MKKIEVKISSFQAENYRLQLLYLTKELKKGIKKFYEVRENRTVIYQSIDYKEAMRIYARCICDKLY